MSCLHIRDLIVDFSTEEGKLRAVGGISIDHREGETLAVLGETGSGKSVVAHAILGLLPDNASVSGSIMFEDRDLLEMTERELSHVRGERIGIVLQNPSLALNPLHTVSRQIAEPLVVHRGFSARSARPIVRAVLERLGFLDLERKLGCYPFQFSGGMNQRVITAASLVLEPRVLIADEPTTGLDPGTHNLVIEELQAVKEKSGSSLLLITHDISLAEDIGDRVAVMYAGRIVECAPVHAFFSHPLHPYSQGLLRSRPENGFHPIPGPAVDLTAPPSGCSFHPRCGFRDADCVRKRPPMVETDGRTVACLRYL